MNRALAVLAVLLPLSLALPAGCGGEPAGPQGPFVEPSCSGCTVECDEAGLCLTACGPDQDCEVACTGEVTCAVVDCAAANNCLASCEGDAVCDLVDCAAANNCEVQCRDGAVCNIDCTGANNCDQLSCTDLASCLV